MPKTVNTRKTGGPVNFMDALLYVLAGSSMAILSLSFLLWLRF